MLFYNRSYVSSFSYICVYKIFKEIYLMKIALIGHGKMGREIERIALERGHQIACIIDQNNRSVFDSEVFKKADVAIEFTTPSTAFDNYKKCFLNNIAVVSGTTGWLEHLPEIEKMCADGAQTFFYASNFSLGVNIFAAINKYLAKIMNGFPDYSVSMEEVHHVHKLDAPSGTAITLAEDIISNLDRKSEWKLEDNNKKESDLSIHSFVTRSSINTPIYASFLCKMKDSLLDILRWAFIPAIKPWPAASSYPVVPFIWPAKNRFFINFVSSVWFNWVGSKKSYSIAYPGRKMCRFLNAGISLRAFICVINGNDDEKPFK